jgi:tetratricopeptide (TPR) repeat protein
MALDAIFSFFVLSGFDYHEWVMSAKSACLALFLMAIASVPALALQSGQDNEIEVHERLAQQYLNEKKPELAIPELKSVVALDPNNVDACANLGVLLFFQRDYEEAVPQLRKAVQLKPGLWKIQALLGLGETHTPDIASARKDLEEAFPQIQDPKLKAEVGLELVGIYHENSDLDDAGRVIGELRKESPENPEVLYAAYRTFADLSGESMLELSMVAPDSAQMHQLLAHEEAREGNTNGAIAQYRKAIVINPHLPGVHFELAELLHTSPDPAIKKEAEHEYRAAVADDPRDEKALCKLGDIAAGTGNIKQAFDDYTKAVELQPADADAQLSLAETLIEMGDVSKAQPLLEASAQLEPTNATVHYRLAMLYKRIGRLDDAKREVVLYKKYKGMKDQLQTVYKDLTVQPDEIREDETPDEKPSGAK